MNIERLVKNLGSNQKDLIYNSMHELIKLIAESPKIQEEIIKYLPVKAIIKLMNYLEDNDSNVRKLITKFFLDLVYDNYIVQQVFCDILGIIPCDGKICLNKIPDAFKNFPRGLPDCIEAIKKTYEEENKEELPLCWYFSIQNADCVEKKVDFILKEEIDRLDYVDPLYGIVGFCMRNPKKLFEKQAKELLIDKQMKDPYKFMRISGKVLCQTNRNTSTNTVNRSLDRNLGKKFWHDSTTIQNSRVSVGFSPAQLDLKNSISTSRCGYKSKGQGDIVKESLDKNNMIHSLCKTERVAPNEFDRSQERGDDLVNYSNSLERFYQSNEGSTKIDNNIGGISEFKNKKMVCSIINENEMIIDNFDCIHTPKVTSTCNINQSLEFNPKGILNIQVQQQHKSIDSTSQKIDLLSSTRSKMNIVSPKDQNTPFGIKKNFDKDNLINIYNNNGLTAPAAPASDSKKPFVKSKEQLYTNNNKNNTPAHKSNVLSKILKDKSLVLKDSYLAKFKNNQIRKTSENCLSISSRTNKKFSKNSDVKSKNSINNSRNNSILERIDNEYSSKKYIYDTLLLKSLEATEKTIYQTLPEDNLEIGYESHAVNKENFKAIPISKLSSKKTKITHFPTYTFKSAINTPRQQTEMRKGTVKFLNVRKSYDISTIGQNKQKELNDILSPHMPSCATISTGCFSNTKNTKQLDLRGIYGSHCKIEHSISPNNNKSNLNQPRQS